MGHRGSQEAPAGQQEGEAAERGCQSATFFVPSTACQQTDLLSDLSGPERHRVAARWWPVTNELARCARMP